MKIEDFKKVKIEAMKARDKDAVAALNVVINKLMLAGIEKKAAGEEMTDADVTKILQKTVNELTEEREGFVKAGRCSTVKGRGMFRRLRDSRIRLCFQFMAAS